MKPIVVSIFSVTNGAGDGFHPAWHGGRGDVLDGCPFSFDEALNAGAADGGDKDDADDLGARLVRTYDPQARAFNGTTLEGACFAGYDLPRMDFSYAILRMADFSDANLVDANFRFADLTYAEFDLAQLEKADFSYGDLCKASLRGARLANANLTGADLEHADFLEADLRGAILLDADCRSARFAGAVFDARTVLPFSRDEARRIGMIESPLLGGAK